MAHVAQAVLPGDDRLGAVAGLRQLAGQVADGVRHAAGDVVRRELAGPAAGERGQVGPRHVAHVDEVPALAAVLVHPGCLAPLERAAEQAGHPGVRRVLGHVRAVDVVVAQRDGGSARGAGPAGGEVLLGGLGRRVDVARVQRRVLRDGARLQGPPADRAGRLEVAGVQRGGRAWARTHHPVLDAQVAALPVDHHRAGQHQPPDLRAVHRGEHDGGAEVVVTDVRGQVLQVHAEPHHRRLMAHGVDAVEGVVRQLTDVGMQPLGPVVGRGRPAVRGETAVDGGEQGVQDPHLVTGVEQGRHDVAADEAGAAGDQDVHGDDGIGGSPYARQRAVSSVGRAANF